MFVCAFVCQTPFVRDRYDACLALIKSACKKADEDFDDPFIVRRAPFLRASIFFLIFPADSDCFSSSRQSAVCAHGKFSGGHSKQQQHRSIDSLCRPVHLPPPDVTCCLVQRLFLCRYSAMQALESQYTHPIAVPRCYEGTSTPVVPGFVPAGAMLPLPRYCMSHQPQSSDIHILKLIRALPFRHNATCEIHEETGLPVAFDCAFQVAV